MRPEFVEIKTKDGLTLPGLFYKAKGRAVVIYLHGNGSSSVFYDETKNRPLALALAKKHISVLYFNNRGAHIIKKLNVRKNGEEKRKLFGMAYEKIKECVEDIDGAIAFLKKLSFDKFYLAGASTGANKICVYNFHRPKNPILKYVLLGGADDIGIYYKMLGKSNFWKFLKIAKNKIILKHGEQIFKELLPEIFSYKGFFEIANPDGDYNVFPFFEVLNETKMSIKKLFRHYKSIKKPTLVVYGEKDEFAQDKIPKIIEILKKYQPDFTYKIISKADHGFKNRKNQLAEIIANWL